MSTREDPFDLPCESILLATTEKTLLYVVIHYSPSSGDKQSKDSEDDLDSYVLKEKTSKVIWSKAPDLVELVHENYWKPM